MMPAAAPKRPRSRRGARQRQRPTPWSSAVALRAAVAAEVDRRFAALFGVGVGPAWRKRALDHFKELSDQDREARKAVRLARRAPGSAVRLGATVNLADPSGNAPMIVALAGEAQTSLERVKGMRLSEDADLIKLPRFADVRSFAIHVFGVLQIPIPRPKVDFPWGQDLGWYDERVLTDSQLATVSLALDPKLARVAPDDVPDGTPVREIIDRERRTIAQARAHHGAREESTRVNAVLGTPRLPYL